MSIHGIINENIGVFLTLVIAIVAYYEFTSPRTKLKDYQFGRRKFSIVLKNTGVSSGTFRVSVAVNGDPIRPDENEFVNCLFAQVPITSPWNGAYPKRTKISRRDFREFSNIFPWVNQQEQETISLPVVSGTHELKFKVQQTGETYVFRYRSDGRNITDSWFLARYGGRQVFDWLKYCRYRIITAEILLEDRPSRHW